MISNNKQSNGTQDKELLTTDQFKNFIISKWFIKLKHKNEKKERKRIEIFLKGN